MKNIFFIGLLAFSTATFAQKTATIASYNLQQAIDYALQNNYKSINAVRDIEASKQKKWETTATGLPQINGGLDYQNYLKQPIILADFNNDGVNEEFVFGTKQNFKASGTLSQLIFDGSYIVALQASKVYLQIYENAKKKTDADIKETLTTAYGNVLLAEESIKILEQNKLILEKNYNEVSQIYKNGLAEEESVEQIAITLATVKNSLNNVIRLREIAIKMLKINMGLAIETEIKLTENLENLAKTNLENGMNSTSFEVTNNIDYQIMSSLVTQKKLFLKLEKSKALPTLSTFLNYGVTANYDTFNFLNTNQKWFGSSVFGASLSIPIFSSFGRNAKTAQAKIAYEQAQTQQLETEQLIKLQFEKCKSDFEFSTEEFATAKSNLKLAERIENKQQIKFKEGLSTSFEFSEAQRQLYATQQNYLQSMVNVVNKRAALERVINP